MRTVTFEFQSPGSASHFGERIMATYPDWRVRVQHRAVDVSAPQFPPADKDVMVMCASLFGATDEHWGPPTGGRSPVASGPHEATDEPLYLLKLGVGFAGDVLRDTEVSLVTRSEFHALNPGAVTDHWFDTMIKPGDLTHGGGGASPRWRLERTAYVGRKA